MIKFIQISCREENKVDYRQAKAVLKHKPDIILFEYPQENKTPETIFNKYPPNKKPTREIKKLFKKLKSDAKKYPWVLSDIKVFENVEKLWKEGRQVYLYYTDAPRKITSYRLNDSKSSKPFPKSKKYQWWWKKMHQREVCMTKHIMWILRKHKNKNLKALVFLEKFHWLHVKFLLGNSSK